MVEQRLAHAEAELRRRGPSCLSDQNEPRRSRSLFGLLALVCNRMPPNAQFEIRGSKCWQDGIVHAPDISEV